MHNDPVIPGYFIAISLLTLLVYGIDKSRAMNKGWRIPESTLHILSLLGGWPGAIIGQQVFRHKRRKGGFMVAFWLTVILNCAALAAYLTLL